jgi:alanine or glycine:cation symporter, AGCS family
MLEQILSSLEWLTEWLWFPVGAILLLSLGIALTLRARFVQLRRFPRVFSLFWSFLRRGNSCDPHGIHPLKAMFASLGGCVGVGNVVGVIMAVQLGGPGSLVWIWVAGFLGMIVKYSEVYLGMVTRVRNSSGSYDGGPMYFLPKAFRWAWVVPLFCVLLCIYGVEGFMYTVMTDSIAINWHINRYLVAAVLLVLIVYAARGGIRRVGEVCSAIIPLFVLIYTGMAIWVLANNLEAIPALFGLIFKSAFTGHAALGGFAGASIMQAMGHGIAKGCYSGDVGIGYDSVIHSESASQHPAQQAALTILVIFLDTFIICTTSVALVLVTGVWTEGLPAAMMVQAALAKYFPYMHLFMPFFLGLLAYSTIIAFLVVGLKAARHLSLRHGEWIYYTYAIGWLILSFFIGSDRMFTIMSMTGVLLLMLNLTAIFRLRRDLSFQID